jgi:hypothetical protein
MEVSSQLHVSALHSGHHQVDMWGYSKNRYKCASLRRSVAHSCHVNPKFYHRSSHLHITWTKWDQYTSSHPLASMTILILSSHLSSCLPRGHNPAGCPTKTDFLTSHTLTCPATPSYHTVPCTEQMCTYNQRSLQHRHVKVCPVFRGESMLKCHFLIQDPRSDLTSPYHLLIVVLKTFYWSPFEVWSTTLRDAFVFRSLDAIMAQSKIAHFKLILRLT